MSFPLSRIAPTQCMKGFRNQCLRGDVHDPRSAMTGQVAGHAGLFSDAYDLAVMAQMLLNKGYLNGQRFLNSKTVDLFTSYQSDISRRGIGWDKPTKDEPGDPHSYPTEYCSPQTFGHYGFTGTAVWIDPKYHFVYVFLSNRVNPDGRSVLEHLDVRSKVQTAFYKAMGVKGKG
ncbi:MAG TPA: serine hydrolase, partial [Chitinophagaceae bacterium]|nr:serine hydrolase [Chitinophagaceae bacterium]